MGKPVIHWEFWTENPEKVSDFYSKVFDWKIQNIPEIKYRMVETQAGAGINGGIMTPERSGPWPGNMSFYIDVEDLATYRKKIEQAGGKILVPEQEVPGMGSFALFSDPDGRVLGIWKQAAAR
jgi:predicted enzyme related to lactoylglutathione lyase